MANQIHIVQEEPAIRIRGLSKAFDERVILRNVSLEVNKGENMVVLGRSGAGKSVLIKILIGLLPPDKGEVRVLGEDIANLKSKELDALRLRVGFAFQSTALYDSMNVRQNLEFPLVMNRKDMSRKDVKAAVEEALGEVGLLDKLNESPSDLSGGQRKRIGIARTLILKPEIMLYDEPTAGLDPVTSEEINALIRDVQKNTIPVPSSSHTTSPVQGTQATAWPCCWKENLPGWAPLMKYLLQRMPRRGNSITTILSGKP